MVSRLTRDDLGQGADWGGVIRGWVPRLEDASRDFVWGGGLIHHPRGCCSLGEHAVVPREDPWAIRLWTGGCSGVHYVTVPELEDCTPDLQRGSLAVCTW